MTFKSLSMIYFTFKMSKYHCIKYQFLCYCHFSSSFLHNVFESAVLVIFSGCEVDICSNVTKLFINNILFAATFGHLRHTKMSRINIEVCCRIFSHYCCFCFSHFCTMSLKSCDFTGCNSCFFNALHSLH